MDHEGDGILPTGDPGIDCGPDPCCETLPVADDGAFCFEQPLNERIRTFLRLEHLLARLRYHEADESVWGRRAAMGALLDILNVMSRHDIRTEVSKELGQRYAGLERLAERDDVDDPQENRIGPRRRVVVSGGIRHGMKCRPCARHRASLECPPLWRGGQVRLSS